YIALQQLIKTAGKRGLQIQLAQDAAKTAEAQFRELMRNLHYLLVTDINNLSVLQTTQHLLETEIAHAQALSAGMDEMLKVGDISLKDNVRIKSLLYSLQSDYADNLRQQQDLEKELRTLLGLRSSEALIATVPQYDVAKLQALNMTALLDSAATRSDIAFARSSLALQQHNLSYQKAMAVPDVTVGVDYDKASSYIPNYLGLQVNIPLPLFNKNRGNIASANWALRGAQAQLQQSQTQVQNEVFSAYNKIKTLLNVQRSAGSWTADYERLLKSMVESYQQRKVSLIEFIDFFSSYKDTRLKQLQQQAALLNTVAELNYVTGSNLIPLK
ncbi:MAG: TolC family protein, partial [Bacteroidota bacterium]|nr:TolC family protein [Bacteroidota bacterium]